MHYDQESPETRRAPPADGIRDGAPFLSTPFFAFARKPFRELHIFGYIVRQHRCGRPLAEILEDPYLVRFGEDRRRILTNPRLVAALKQNAVDALERELDRQRRPPADSPAPAGEHDGASIVRMVEALHG
jgi:hypothetical protein